MISHTSKNYVRSTVRSPWKSSYRSRRRALVRGVTLVEMLVAMAITLLLMAAVIKLFGEVADAVNKSRATIAMSERLRNARNLIQNDLKNYTAIGPVPLDSGRGLGYLEIIEGPGRDIFFGGVEVAPMRADSDDVIPRGASWDYFDDIDTNVAEGYPVDGATLAWNDPNFNTATSTGGVWVLNAPAVLGYGVMDGGPAILTTLDFGGVTTTKYTTYLFRKIINVTDVWGVTEMKFSVLADDGAVVYVNGTDVGRYNMAAGVPATTTFATAGGSETVYQSINVDLSAFPGLLQEGANSIAVELHQQSLASSDVGFDLELDLLGNVVEIEAPPNNRNGDTDDILALTVRDPVKAFAGRFGSNTVTTFVPGDGPSNGLIAWYKFDSGNPAGKDSSISGLPDGIVSGGATLVADGVRGDVLQLDGTTGTINLGSDAIFDTPEYTVSAWLWSDVNPAGPASAVYGWETTNWLNLGLNGIEFESYPGSTAGPFVPPAGLVAHWSLDDAVGTNPVVDSVSGFNASQTGAPVLGIAGKIGTAGSFPAGGNYFRTAGLAGLNLPAFTFSFWFNPLNSGGGGENVVIANRDGENGFIVYQKNDAIEFWLKGGGWQVQSVPIVRGVDQWYHIVGSFDGSTKKFYVTLASAGSATVDATMSATLTLHGSGPRFGIGVRGDGGLPLNGGNIDDVQIYNVALSDADVDSLFQNSAGSSALISQPSDGPAAISRWYHVVTVASPGKNELWVDGQLMASHTQTPPVGLGVDNLWIGSNGAGGEFWDGKMDDVRIYNRVLGAAEITELLDGGVDVSVTNDDITRSQIAEVIWFVHEGTLYRQALPVVPDTVLADMTDEDFNANFVVSAKPGAPLAGPCGVDGADAVTVCALDEASNYYKDGTEDPDNLRGEGEKYFWGIDGGTGDFLYFVIYNAADDKAEVYNYAGGSPLTANNMKAVLAPCYYENPELIYEAFDSATGDCTTIDGTIDPVAAPGRSWTPNTLADLGNRKFRYAREPGAPYRFSKQLVLDKIGAASSGLTPPAGLVAWYDAGKGVTEDGTGVLTWADQSGNGYDATRASGAPTLVANAINSQPEIQLRNKNSYFNVNFNIFVKEQYVVGRAATPTWNNYGAYFANKSGRPGSYLFNSGNTGFYSSEYPAAFSRDGVVKANSGSGMLVPMQEYMVLKITVNNNNTTPRQYYVGRSDHSASDLDVAEIIAFDRALTAAEEATVGGYLAAKYGITTTYPAPIGGGGGGLGDLAVISNVLGFDIQVWDPDTPLKGAGTPTVFDTIVLTPSDVGYADSALAVSGSFTGAFVDLNWLGADSAAKFSGPGHVNSGLQAAAGGTAIYDTGSSANEDGKRGSDRIDNDGDGAVDELDEQETSPPYPTQLKGIQIKLRVLEPDSGQVLEVTIIQKFPQN